MTVRILHVEDNLNDAALVQAMLDEASLACEMVRVETHDDFAAALERNGFDLIISDFTLPSFDGRKALKLARTMAPEVPFLFFSGTIGEERAVEALQDGATDYVLKQRPARLVPAVRRALHEVEDRRERERLERQLHQAQKMEAIGQLASGIAHDFNNLLTIINGYSELSLQTLPPDNPSHDNIVQIKEAGERASLLTRQLLAFSRRQVLDPKVLDLNAVVTNLEKMLRRMIREDIHLALELSPDLGRVKADPGQIDQVLMNLVVNARDAISQGGRVTIRTADVALDEEFTCRHVGARQGAYVMLAVSDTGCGMDAETQKRVFEPFFTTKEKGKGTGLGLATVYGIVKQSEGYIQMDSAVGAGTTFLIYLPRVEERAEPVEPVRKANLSLRGSETILLVEDEEPVRNLVKRILLANGYVVLEAADGIEALQLFDRHAGTIGLVLTDIVMPGLSGPDLAERLRAQHPNMKMLFFSGYTDEAVARHGIRAEGSNFFPKPFSPTSLLRKVREVLDAPAKEET